MSIYKWKDGIVVKCDKTEGLFTFWISCIRDDFDQFIREHKNKTEQEKIDIIKKIIIERANHDKQ